MAQTNTHDQRQPLPEKIERRLAELLQMGEFDQGDLAHCRRTYWAARADWHKILMDCYEIAQQRQRASTAGVSTPTSTPPAPAQRAAAHAARPLPQGASA